MGISKKPEELRIVFDFKGEVNIEDLSSKLSSLRKALITMDKSLAVGRKVDYQITQITMNSPIELITTPSVQESGGMDDDAGICRLVEGVRHVREYREAPTSFTLEMLESIKELTKGLDDERSIKLFNGQSTMIDNDFRHAVDSAIGPDTSMLGSYRGRLESMNVHGAKMSCYLYPRIGPQRIKCVFKEAHRISFTEAFDHYVSIHGELKYKCMEDYPHEIVATEPPIILGPHNTDLLRELKGSAPMCTGDLSASEFVGGLRNGD